MEIFEPLASSAMKLRKLYFRFKKKYIGICAILIKRMAYIYQLSVAPLREQSLDGHKNRPIRINYTSRVQSFQ